MENDEKEIIKSVDDKIDDLPQTKEEIIKEVLEKRKQQLLDAGLNKSSSMHNTRRIRLIFDFIETGNLDKIAIDSLNYNFK